MTEPGPIPPPRPRPARPEIRITPLRDPVPDERPRFVDAAAICWLIGLAALVLSAIWQAFNLVAVREAMGDALATDHPATTRDDITNTVSIIMIGNAAAALFILVLAVIGIIRVRDRIASGRTMLTLAGLLAVAVSVQFWIVTDAAHHVVGDVIAALPLVTAVFAVVGTGLLYAPVVGKWLKSAKSRR